MITKKSNARERAKTKIRNRMEGTAERPRLTVYRSLNNIYVQAVDDTVGTTIASASTLSAGIKDAAKELKGKVAEGKLVGKEIARILKEKNIVTVVFDRNGYKYHGRIKAIADGAREGGLQF